MSHTPIAPIARREPRRRRFAVTPQGMALIIAFVLLWSYLVWPTKRAPLAKPSPLPAPPYGEPAFSQRLVAVGDLHGDIANARKVLKFASIIDDSDTWIAGRDILVQTGDIVDRGTYARDIYQLMQRLRSESFNAGGQLHSILGNHEMMNALADWRYVTSAEIAYWGGTAKRQHDMSTEGWLGKEWLANYTVTARVSLAPYDGTPELSFTHGSLKPSYPGLLPYPDKINELGRSLLQRASTPPIPPPHPPSPYPGYPRGTTPEEAELYGSDGPLWWRGLAMADEKSVCAWAKELKDKLGVRRVIGGHTPDFDKIVSRCDASIIIIDTGISSAYGGVLSALEIVYSLTPAKGDSADGALLVASDEGVVRISDVGDRIAAAGEGGKPLKPGKYVEREEVHALYEGKRVKLKTQVRVVTV